jgi:hypothetical protein
MAQATHSDPFSSRDWEEILAYLPPKADRPAAKAAIKAAAHEYRTWDDAAKHAEHQRQSQQWRLVHRILTTKSAEKMREALAQPAREISPEPLKSDLLRLIEDLSSLPERANSRAKVRFVSRVEHLYAWIFDAWIAAGGRLSKTQTGALTNFTCTIVNRIAGKSLTGAGMKKAVERYEKRRSVHLKGEGDLKADATVVKLKSE